MTRDEVIRVALDLSRAEDYSSRAKEMATEVLAHSRCPYTADIPESWARWLAAWLVVAMELPDARR